MADFSFSPQKRLKESQRFDAVFARKCSIADDNLVMYVAPNNSQQTRIGLVVSRKLGNAVVRNRWKRLLREAFRLSDGELPSGLDLVVIPRHVEKPTLLSLKNSLQVLAARGAKKLNRSRS